MWWSFLMFIKILYNFKATPKLLFIVVDYLQIQSQVAFYPGNFSKAPLSPSSSPSSNLPNLSPLF